MNVFQINNIQRQLNKRGIQNPNHKEGNNKKTTHQEVLTLNKSINIKKLHNRKNKKNNLARTTLKQFITKFIPFYRG